MQLNCRSENIEHTKIYFTKFGVVELKIWILQVLNRFLENLFLKIKSKTGSETLKTPQIYTQHGPPATDSGPLTPLVNESERESTFNEQISPAVRFPATG